MSENFFAVEKVDSKRGDVVAASISARESQEVQAMIVIAKRFPRDERAAMDRILNACQRPTLAEVAAYEYSRGGATVTGPSIRLAETAAQMWGNVQFGVRELDQQPGESTMEAFAWDLETNTRVSKVFRVQHVRHTKKGSYKLEDPRDIYETVSNSGARRLRACILAIIPGDVIEAAMKECDKTLLAKAEVTPERVKKMLEEFGKYQVTKEMIEKRIQRRIDTVSPGQFIQLGKIYNSMRDGMSAPVDWFEVETVASKPEKKRGSEAVAAALNLEAEATA